MNAKEIIDKIKQVVLSTDEVELAKVEVTEEVAKEEVKSVELADEVTEEKKDVVEKETTPEMPQAMEMDKYATKEELASQLSELKAVISQLKEIIDPSKEKDVPQELSKEKEVVELASEPDVLVHSPEASVEQTKLKNYQSKSPKGMKSLIYDKLFNN